MLKLPHSGWLCYWGTVKAITRAIFCPSNNLINKLDTNIETLGRHSSQGRSNFVTEQRSFHLQCLANLTINGENCIAGPLLNRSFLGLARWFAPTVLFPNTTPVEY